MSVTLEQFPPEPLLILESSMALSEFAGLGSSPRGPLLDRVSPIDFAPAHAHLLRAIPAF